MKMWSFTNKLSWTRIKVNSKYEYFIAEIANLSLLSFAALTGICHKNAIQESLLYCKDNWHQKVRNIPFVSWLNVSELILLYIAGAVQTILRHTQKCQKQCDTGKTIYLWLLYFQNMLEKIFHQAFLVRKRWKSSRR